MSFETTLTEDTTSPDQKNGLLVVGGLLGALAASSCCVLPLALTVFGISGAWMANLRALAPYQPYLVAASVGLLAYGFYRVYRKPRVACGDGSACARPLPNRIVKAGLWLGAVIVAVVLSFPIWFPAALPYLP